MKVFMIASDKYAHLIKPNVTLFNKYFPGQDIVCLGYDESNAPHQMPNNFSFISLGTQSKEWTTPLIRFFKDIEDDYFVILLEDILLVGDVDPEKFSLLENEVSSGRAQKAMLDSHLNFQADYQGDEIIFLRQNASYRTSLHPAIWNKDYFLKYLKPHFQFGILRLRICLNHKMMVQILFRLQAMKIYLKQLTFMIRVKLLQDTTNRELGVQIQGLQGKI